MTTPNDRSVERAAFEKAWADDTERLANPKALGWKFWLARATLERAEVGSVVPERAWQAWDGSYEKQFYDVWASRYEVVLACWPNAGKMAATDGSGRHWRPEDCIAVRVSDFQSAPPSLAETQRSSHTAGSDDPKAESGSTQAGREPLTDEQIDAIALEVVYAGDTRVPWRDHWCEDIGRPFARAIERALAPSSTPRD